MQRVLDFRLTLLGVTIFIRLLCPYPKRFYWFDLALSSDAGSAEICLYSQEQGAALAIHFIHWSKLCWITRNNSSKASTNTAST